MLPGRNMVRQAAGVAGGCDRGSRDMPHKTMTDRNQATTYPGDLSRLLDEADDGGKANWGRLCINAVIGGYGNRYCDGDGRKSERQEG